MLPTNTHADIAHPRHLGHRHGQDGVEVGGEDVGDHVRVRDVVRAELGLELLVAAVADHGGCGGGGQREEEAVDVLLGDGLAGDGGQQQAQLLVVPRHRDRGKVYLKQQRTSEETVSTEQVCTVLVELEVNLREV